MKFAIVDSENTVYLYLEVEEDALFIADAMNYWTRRSRNFQVRVAFNVGDRAEWPTDKDKFWTDQRIEALNRLERG